MGVGVQLTTEYVLPLPPVLLPSSVECRSSKLSRSLALAGERNDISEAGVQQATYVGVPSTLYYPGTAEHDWVLAEGTGLPVCFLAACTAVEHFASALPPPLTSNAISSSPFSLGGGEKGSAMSFLSVS